MRLYRINSTRRESSFDWGSEVLDAENLSIGVIFFAEQVYKRSDIKLTAMGYLLQAPKIQIESVEIGDCAQCSVIIGGLEMTKPPEGGVVSPESIVINFVQGAVSHSLIPNQIAKTSFLIKNKL